MRFACLALFATVAPVVHGQFLPLRNHRAFSLPFLRLAPRAELLPSGAREWELVWTQSNDVSRHVQNKEVVEEDGEFTRLNLVWRSADRRGTEWTVELPLTAFHAGFLDPVIDFIHEGLLGNQDPLRRSVPRYRSLVRYEGRTFGAGVGFGGITITAARRVGGGRLALAVKLPMTRGDELFDTGSVDFGVGFGLARRIDAKWTWSAHVGLVRQGSWKAFDDVRRWVDQETLAVAYVHAPGETWIVQFQSESSALRTGIATADAAHRMGSIGFRRSGPSGSAWTITIAEDYDPLVSLRPQSKQIGPDVVLGASWSWRF